MSTRIANPEAYIPTGDYNPHNVRPFCIGNEYGYLAIAYGSHEHEALGEANDADLLKAQAIDEADLAEAEANESVIYVGNASEPIDGDNLTMFEIANRAPAHFSERPWEDTELTGAERLYRDIAKYTDPNRYRGLDWEVCLFGQLYKLQFEHSALAAGPEPEDFIRLANRYRVSPTVMRRIYIMTTARSIRDDWHEAVAMCRKLLIEDVPISDLLAEYDMHIWSDYCA